MTAQICATCLKPEHLCVCDAIEPVDNRVFVLILQHPQEKRELLGTAQIAHLQLRNSAVRIGLSWPGLKRILGREVDPRRWGVLYLGTAKQGADQDAKQGAKPGTKPGARPEPGGAAPKPPLAVVDRNGKPVSGADAVLAGLEGIIVLDGTWSQAKTLWWRNPWLIKCRRLILHPPMRSLYGQARREPRRESVSSLESAAFVLATLAKDPALYDRLLRPFATLLTRIKAPRPGPAASAEPPEAAASADTDGAEA
ncbi:DTW domain-containing protein [Azospirillum sp. RWY-5-1]|uniref:tRNA-uridine aminocarboxypropyltransferase n=1 Tax=Azospirillum oleiclasticum TaxID=2735135 RepID=A0ABX2TJX6_9PROT|nr:tRNA-uridine aminocarboxypropyltransferase [Azospirillum oleiclasticum]NYZ17263.1 DTW domain-containing protein [Azospirillum oleiclasticum]NYZ23453.1 DTW domain-containing protein [Azospirillum oleiclasticum]